MTTPQPRLTRRALLGAGLVVLAGCTSHRTATATAPDAGLLAAARAGELALLASSAEGTPEHAAHLAHLQALGGQVLAPGATPASAPTSPSYVDVRASVAVLQSAADRARDGGNAALLASVAASHALLAARLR